MDLQADSSTPAAGYRVWVQDVGGNWLTVASGGGGSGLQQFSFASTLARAVRVEFTGGGLNSLAPNRVTIASWQVYSTGSAGDDYSASTQSFDAWGNVTQSLEGVPTFGFTGREPDASGLTYYRARYYSPGLGRFVSRDPIGIAGGINAYAYAENNPTNLVDPMGLAPASPLDFLGSVGNAISGYFGNASAKFSEMEGQRSGIGQGSRLNPLNDPWFQFVGKAFAADAAFLTGVLTGDQGLQNLAIDGMRLNVPANDGIGLAIGLGLGGRIKAGELGVPGPEFVPNSIVATPYARPTGAGPTPAQTASVQGQPCVACGQVTPRQVADHDDPLVVQYYREGAVNVQQQRSLDAVQSHCPACSASQGGFLSGFSRRIKELLGL